MPYTLKIYFIIKTSGLNSVNEWVTPEGGGIKGKTTEGVNEG